MTADNGDVKYLKTLLPSFILDERETVFLWLFLLEERQGIPVEGVWYGSPSMYGWMCDEISNKITQNPNYTYQLEAIKNSTFLPLHNFAFLDQTGRQPNFFIFHILKLYFNGCKPLCFHTVEHLKPKTKMIALYDGVEEDAGLKIQQLENIKSLWALRQNFVRKLAWYSEGDEKKKCTLAWEWYQDKYLGVQVPVFSSANDLLGFLDTSNFLEDQQLYQLEQIKKRFKTQQVQKNRKYKTQTNFSLSNQVRDELEELARLRNCSMTALVEDLISTEYALHKKMKNKNVL